MGITSLSFLALALLSIFIYYIIGNRYRVIFLALISCAFVATYSYILLFYILVYALINYYFGLQISLSRFKKSFFVAGIIVNLSQLILLKYVTFTINPLLDILNIETDLSIFSRIIIPVGVSFFTLQSIGYLININLGWEKPEKNFIRFLLYIIFYPRFISGPIDRSNHFLPQLKVVQPFNEQNVRDAFRLILFGLFKKVAIANQLAPVVISAYSNSGAPSIQSSFWIILLIQPVYIYFDFSGYTDIAFGFARAYGIELRPNFNRPFMSENITSFWKRFHISLSSWFHDYIFIRTSYKYRRWGKRASTYALFLTWVLFGIWHGAGWTFMFLGLLQALAVYYEFTTKQWRVKMFSIIPDYPRIWLGRLITYLFYGISLVFFFAPDINSAFAFFPKLFTTTLLIPEGIRREIYLLVLGFVIVLMAFEIIKEDFNNFYNKVESLWLSNKSWNRFLRWSVYFLIVTVVLVFNKEVQEFIYFKF